MSSVNELTCPLCSKSFENKKSQTRHATYCRKKSKQPLRTRKRSCLECIRAKAHCDALVSPCSRCLQKGVNCKYDHQKQEEVSQKPLKAPRPVIEISGQCGSATSSLSQAEPLLSNWIESLNTSVSDREVEAIISSQDINLSSTAVALSPVQNWDAYNVFSVPSTQSSISAWTGKGYNGRVWNVPSPDPLSQHLIPRVTKAFLSRGLRSRQFSLVRKFVLSTLRSYPKMMLSNSDLPHFIHPVCMSEEIRLAENAKAGPLSRCAGIAALWSTRNSNNKHYLWKILRMEQERLLEESDNSNDWEAVAALQAITLYFLLRVSAEDDEDANFDVPLIETMIKLSQRVKGITVRYCNPASTTRPNWEAWVLVESLRRTITTIFIFEFLFDISPGLRSIDCQSVKHWSEMLLPSAKQLWAAKTRLQWQHEYRALKDDRRPTFGELMEHDNTDADGEALLEWWMEHVDEFGTLVINTASLLDVVI